MARSGSPAPHPVPLAPRSVNNDYVTAEITYSAARVRHDVPAWSRATFRKHM